MLPGNPAPTGDGGKRGLFVLGVDDWITNSNALVASLAWDEFDYTYATISQ